MAPERGLAQRLINAIEELFDNDAGLLIRDVNERTIKGRLARHLRLQFDGWNVDCKYNRDGHRVKRIDGRVVEADIIVHRRGMSDNLLVTEVKKSNTREADDEDLQKLLCLLRFASSLSVRFLSEASWLEKVPQAR